jgi:hypothetical protein
MKIPYQTALTFVALVALLVLQYQNCSSYHDPSPFDVKSDALSSTSKPNDVRIDSPSGVLDLGQDDLALSVGGGCNVGLNTKHYIEIKISDQNNNPVVVREDNLCPSGGQNLPADCFRAQQFRCEHGRYYVHLPVNCGAYRNQPTSLYRMVGQLVVIDDSGKEIRDNKAAFDRFFQIAWRDGSCP